MLAQSSLDLLAEITLDAYLLARYSSDDEILPDGRQWERTVADLLWRPGLHRRQGAGQTTLFGVASASGVPHELDASASGWAGCLLIECKSRGDGLGKADVSVFTDKTFDFYCASLPPAAEEQWWQLMVSAALVHQNIRRFCIHKGLILCEPERLPLPVLLRAAGRPVADQYLPEMQLQEVVRLGERGLLSMQERWKQTPSGELLYQPNLWSSDDIEDLLWLQDELSGDILDLYDQYRPGSLERRAGELCGRLRRI